MNSVESRLQQLERDNRLMRRMLGGIGVCLAVVFTAGAAATMIDVDSIKAGVIDCDQFSANKIAIGKNVKIDDSGLVLSGGAKIEVKNGDRLISLSVADIPEVILKDKGKLGNARVRLMIENAPDAGGLKHFGIDAKSVRGQLNMYMDENTNTNNSWPRK